MRVERNLGALAKQSEEVSGSSGVDGKSSRNVCAAGECSVERLRKRHGHLGGGIKVQVDGHLCEAVQCIEPKRDLQYV